MKERQKENIYKIFIGICSILTIIAFQLKLDMGETTSHTVLSAIVDLTKSFREYSIIYILLVLAVYQFYQYTSKKNRGGTV